jgi:cytochrome c-type protein NapB
MNGKQMMQLTLAAAMTLSAGQALAEESVKSLRGTTAIEADSAVPEAKKWRADGPMIERDFEQQPPLIPHKSQNFKINLKSNTCLNCHGATEYEDAEAPMVGKTHFKDPGAAELTEISAARYFCTQCHVEQREIAPLVDNEFKSAKASQ